MQFEVGNPAEQSAMAELGQLRSREFTVAFVVSYAVGGLILMVEVGLLAALLGGAVVAGVIAKGWLIARKVALIDKVCRKHGVRREDLGADKLLID
jgi:hypothetical protein